jgi:hypothetical protein
MLIGNFSPGEHPMKLWFPLAVLIAITPCTSNVAEAAGYGLGIKSCGEFAKSYAENPTLAETLYFGWAEGFMSGLNFVNEANKKPLREITGGNESMRSYQSYIRNYCDEHPLAPYYGAMVNLYQSLPQTKPNSN